MNKVRKNNRNSNIAHLSSLFPKGSGFNLKNTQNHIKIINCQTGRNDSQVSSIDTALACGTRGCELESRQYQSSCENGVCFKFPWMRNLLIIVS